MGEIVVASPREVEAIEPALDAEQKLIELWLHGLSPHTQRSYRRAWKTFRAFLPAGLPINQIQLVQLQAFADELAKSGLVAGSRHAILSGVKSLLAYAHGLGLLPFDIGHPLRLPAGKETLNERILEEDQVSRLIEATPAVGRDRVILELLYVAGVRVSELAGLSWLDLRPRLPAGGQITVHGKGSKTRTVLIEDETLWAAMIGLKPPAAGDGDAVFVSARGSRLCDRQIRRIVAAAARRAGLSAHVSPHWLRHCHASHALDHGAPVHLVQQTLGHASVATTSRYLHARPRESSASFIRRRGSG